MNRKASFERNKAIAIRILNGEPCHKVASDYKISRSRPSQITLKLSLVVGGYGGGLKACRRNAQELIARITTLKAYGEKFTPYSIRDWI